MVSFSQQLPVLPYKGDIYSPLQPSWPGNGSTKTMADWAGTTSSPLASSTQAPRVTGSSDACCNGCKRNGKLPAPTVPGGTGTRVSSNLIESTITTRAKCGQSSRGIATPLPGRLFDAGGALRVCMTITPGNCLAPQPGKLTFSKTSTPSSRPIRGVDARSRRNSQNLAVVAEAMAAVGRNEGSRSSGRMRSHFSPFFEAGGRPTPKEERPPVKSKTLNQSPLL
mmetsp:Transcript_113307/g.253035  ORF Transcript_113307/g.253035 Transcript_113307/m.253035 type:complete len:224 (+) Transcript_113307:25-696(+)